MKGLLVGGLADAQPLIVVVVEGVERIGIVDDDLEECIALAQVAVAGCVPAPAPVA